MEAFSGAFQQCEIVEGKRDNVTMECTVNSGIISPTLDKHRRMSNSAAHN